MSFKSKSWQFYRTEFQTLENKLNEQLSLFEKIASIIHRSSAQHMQSNDQTMHSFAMENKNKNKEQNIEQNIQKSNAIYEEIQLHLQKLHELKKEIAEVKDRMVNNTENNDKALLLSVFLNCQSVYVDYRKQTQRLQNRIQSDIQRRELLVIGGKHRRRIANGNGRSDQEFLLDERSSMHSSLQMATDAIDAVIDIDTDLKHQSYFSNQINHGLGILSKRFPRANELIWKIKKYRNRDSIVLACVCALCLTLIFFYWINK